MRVNMKVCIKMFIHIDDKTTQLSRPMWIGFDENDRMIVENIYVDEHTAQELTQLQYDQIISELCDKNLAILYKVVG